MSVEDEDVQRIRVVELVESPGLLLFAKSYGRFWRQL